MTNVNDDRSDNSSSSSSRVFRGQTDAVYATDMSPQNNINRIKILAKVTLRQDPVALWHSNYDDVFSFMMSL